MSKTVVWIAVSEIDYEGATIIGVAADVETARAMCRDYLGDEAIGDWGQRPDGSWASAVYDSDANRYTVTEHAVKAPSPKT